MSNLDDVFEALAKVSALYIPETTIPTLFDFPETFTKETYTPVLEKLEKLGFRRIYMQRTGTKGFYFWAKGQIDRNWSEKMDWSLSYLLQVIRATQNIPEQDDHELIRSTFIICK